MKVDYKIKSNALIITVNGEIDHHSAGIIREQIIKNYAVNHCIDMVFDFTELSFMDSAGIGMLIGRYKQVSINRGTVAAVGISPAIERIFDMSGLNKLIKKYPTVDNALGIERAEVI